MEEVLNDVAEFKPPNFGSNVMQTELQQGRYVPRRHTWLSLFDPLHTLLRAVHRRDYQVRRKVEVPLIDVRTYQNMPISCFAVCCMTKGLLCQLFCSLSVASPSVV